MEPISTIMALAQFAPSILRFFGVGEKPVAIAEQVVGIAQTVTGAKTPQEAVEALRKNADLAQQFNLAVLAADAEFEKAVMADRQDARSRDVEIRKVTGGTNRRADVMVIGAVVGLISCLLVLVLFRKDIPGEVVGIVSTVAAIFGTCLKDAFSFEFGSSRGSKEKDALLGKIASMP